MEDALVVLASLPCLAPVAKQMLNAISYGLKRYLEPYFIAREEKIKAKTELEIFRTNPLRQIQFAQEFIHNTDGRYPSEAVQEMKNTINILLGAVNYTKDANKEESAPKEDNNEWYARFFDEAKYISDQELQDVWARLLAERITNPKGINNRVLYFIRDMSKDEIETVCRALRVFVNNSFIPNNIIDKISNLSQDLVTLFSLGIITPGSSFCWSAYVEKGSTLDGHGVTYEVSPIAEGKTEIEVDCYCLTPEGVVINRLSNECLSKDEAKLICDTLNEKWKGKATVKII
jgi:hypothetical protein